ncbi:RNA chaperone Hfq [Bacillus thuringiensis]|uniref:RNA chaperone Hfq n=1 Tax=Bacillus thuringiensis TaxID=1428 RepID=A0A437SDN0_BACTU|nr:RNA chaperone Hfq [Bacillus thuringiensis]RVU61715.1 RNA chaperone Hfq [Bacillus thuringiensis]
MNGISFFQTLQQNQQQNITLILLKGLHVKGMIRGFDTYSVLIEVEGKQQLVYKHAISTIRF